jgi:hypothetical protein
MPTQTLHKLVEEEQEEGGAFEPEQIAVMTTAFDLLLSDLRLVKRDDPIVMMVAKAVIELVRNGERDPEQVRQKVLGQRRPGPHSFAGYCPEPEVRTYPAARTVANFGFKRGTRNHKLRVPLIPKFASEIAARVCELRIRDTSSVH